MTTPEVLDEPALAGRDGCGPDGQGVDAHGADDHGVDWRGASGQGADGADLALGPARDGRWVVVAVASLIGAVLALVWLGRLVTAPVALEDDLLAVDVPVATEPGAVVRPPTPDISTTGGDELTAHEVPPPLPPVPVPDAGWVARVAAATGIPGRAVESYGRAALRLSEEQPGCRLGWTTLAGIGAVESGHGSHGGATLRDDGRPSIPVIGPALDGRPGFAAIASTSESIAWHGDPRWDHAVGPMQLIPSTWERWVSDGDGDGAADPHDLDDAAYAAGRYLCASGGDLSTGPAWHAAVLSYNRSEEYVQQVLGTANGYARAAARG